MREPAFGWVCGWTSGPISQRALNRQIGPLVPTPGTAPKVTPTQMAAIPWSGSRWGVSYGDDKVTSNVHAPSDSLATTLTTSGNLEASEDEVDDWMEVVPVEVVSAEEHAEPTSNTSTTVRT